MEITRMNPDLKHQVAMVDFSATWCSPCREMAPVIRDLAKKYQDRGRGIKRFVGVQSRETLEKHLNAILSDRI